MQVAQQFNSIVMALAGAERIFKLIDEEPEQDTGSVTLVNAKKDKNGTITECTERTGMWAWKKPADENGTVTYTVKPVLYDKINLEPGLKYTGTMNFGISLTD